MDKNTLLAVILSAVVIIAGFQIQNKLNPPKEQKVIQQTQKINNYETKELSELISSGRNEISSFEKNNKEENVVLETEVFEILFSTKGAVVKSIKLKNHKEKEKPVEMIFTNSDSDKLEDYAFNIYFEGIHKKPVDSIFTYKLINEDDFTIIEFTSSFVSGKNNPPFKFIKTYKFKNDEYLFALDITIENSINDYPVISNSEYAYTLEFGPQIGPEFKKLGKTGEIRKFVTFNNKKLKNIKISKSGIKEIEERYTWTGLLGKYFSVICIPDANLYKTRYVKQQVTETKLNSKMLFSRPAIKSSKSTDSFKFYIGPKRIKELVKYNKSDKNAFYFNNLNLEKSVGRGNILGWLEFILKKMLLFFYSIIPNYGVAIILLTITSKIILWPLTHKSFESTSKMQALSPKMSLIKEKFKDNPQKMNTELASLYKQEGVNPMGGCLPMLLQMPIFFALYGLFSSHFDLRGSSFISFWINDLSAPESIFKLPFVMPIFGWTDIRLLPFLMAGSQILSSKFMQTPDSSSNTQMKMFTYLMPVMFLFILYDAPSGLLLYWVLSSILSAVQQVYISKKFKRKTN